MDYKEFAGRIKSKYPQYADMQDEELASKMVAKFPDQYSDVQLKDAPNAASQDHPDDTMRYLAQMAKAVYGVGKRIVNPADLDAAAYYRGVKRLPEPEGSNNGLSNFAGRATIPAIVGAGTGMLMGPVGAGMGAARAIATTAAAEGAAGLAGEGAGQLSARALGNKEALSGGELAGQGALSAAFGGAARGIGEGLVAGIPKARDATKTVVDLASKYGLDLTPAEIRGSRALSGLETFLHKTMFGAEGIEARRAFNAQSLRSAKDRLISVAGTAEERQVIGDAFLASIKQRAESFNNAVKETYRRAFAVVPPLQRIELNNFINQAEKISSEAGVSPFGGGGGGEVGDKVINFYNNKITYSIPEGPVPEIVPPKSIVVGRVNAPSPEGLGGTTSARVEVPIGPIQQKQTFREITLGSRIDPVTGGPAPVRVTPRDMVTIRNDISGAIADYDSGLRIGVKTMSSQKAGAFKRLLTAIESDMDAYAETGSVGKEFIDKYRSAKGLAQLNYKTFNDRSVVGVLKKYPDAVSSVIGDSVNSIQQLKKASGERGFMEVRKLWLTDMLNESKNATGSNLANAIGKYSDDTLSEIFKTDRQALKELRDIAQLQSAVGAAERTTPMTGSSRVAAGGVMAYIGSLIGGPVGAGVSVIAPAAATEIYLSPYARKIALEGLRAAPGSRAKAIAAARLASFLGKAAVSQGNDNGQQRTK